MNWLIVFNDFRRNKTINSALFLFMMFAATLAILSVVMATQTFTSITELYQKAQPPHFLQMHKGEIKQQAIDEFLSVYPGVTYWQTITMIDVYGDQLTVVGEAGAYDLSDCRLDIGLVQQPADRDLLLNAEHQRVTLGKDEIGMPVILKGMYDLEIGDRVILRDKGVRAEFVIKEFILDAQMNSTLASSTRILLSDEDFERLSGAVGEYEYLIEAYFTDLNAASTFQTAYENGNLPKNGQAVTYKMIFLLSAFTDLTTVFVLLLVSFFLIIIAFICVKFTIMAALEEEIAEIATMKAIGLNFTEIRRLYLSKYRILALLGVIAGYLCALLLNGIVTNHIRATFGQVKRSGMTICLALMVGGIVYLLIDYYCKKVLKMIKKVTVVDALVRGAGFEKHEVRVIDGLYKARKLPVNLLMATREIFYQYKNWFIVFAVVLSAEMMILVPVKLWRTFEAPEFITYMGSSLEDILIEVEPGENLGNGYVKVKKVLENDAAIHNYNEYRRIRVTTTAADDEPMNLHIDSGVKAGSGLQYLSGMAPQEEYEIALSYLNAEKTGKRTGDQLLLFFGDREQEFLISGIYQDVTSGGFTAKTTNDFLELKAEKYTFSVNLTEITNVEEKADEWGKVVGPGVTVDPMAEFIQQTLGGISNQLKTIVLVVVVIGISTALLITILFLKLRLAKDAPQLAIVKAIGFSAQDLKRQYMVKIGVVSLSGILAGIILTDRLGEKLVNVALGITNLGIKQIELIVIPVIEYFICPLLLLVSILLVTWMVVKIIHQINLLSMINE